MPETVLSLSKGIKDAWANLSKSQRMVVLSGGVLALTLLLLLVFFSARGPSYETLWSNLDSLDAGAIVSELEKQGIPYKFNRWRPHNKGTSGPGAQNQAIPCNHGASFVWDRRV